MNPATAIVATLVSLIDRVDLRLLVTAHAMAATDRTALRIVILAGCWSTAGKKAQEVRDAGRVIFRMTVGCDYPQPVNRQGRQHTGNASARKGQRSGRDDAGTALGLRHVSPPGQMKAGLLTFRPVAAAARQVHNPRR